MTDHLLCRGHTFRGLIHPGSSSLPVAAAVHDNDEEVNIRNLSLRVKEGTRLGERQEREEQSGDLSRGWNDTTRVNCSIKGAEADQV